METWEDTIAELRTDYVHDSLERAAEMERQLDHLERTPGDGPALERLLRAFHGFAGSGTTYGFPEVTALGQEGERSCASVKKREASPAAIDLQGWRTLVGRLRAAFAVPSPAARAQPAAAPGPPGVDAPDILVVDDDTAIFEGAARLAVQEGMTVRCASSGAEGLQAIDERMPDGLVVGTRLPDGPGYDLVERLRSRAGGDLAAVLMVASGATFLDKVDAITCGADGYFQKPLDWMAVQRRLQHLLERNRAEPARILYVEDDPHQAAFVRTVLRSAGYEVAICPEPKGFEALLTSFRPDLILMDIVLPGIMGYDLARFVRQDERYATLPIVFLTTEARMDARVETARAGGDGHLEKPVTPALLLSDVATRVERARYLKTLLNRDGLTGLLTHTAFLERARVALAQARRDPTRLMVWVSIDLDHFKEVNDRYGHPIGDRVLAALSALLRRRLRQADTIGRYGGEELAVIVEGLGEAEAVRLVARLLVEFASTEHHGADHQNFGATFSAGVAALDPETMDVDGWRKAAGDALHAAKTAGRNCVRSARG